MLLSHFSHFAKMRNHLRVQTISIEGHRGFLLAEYIAAELVSPLVLLVDGLEIAPVREYSEIAYADGFKCSEIRFYRFAVPVFPHIRTRF